MRRRTVWGLTALLAAVLSGACSDSNGPGESLDARIRFVNVVNSTTGDVEIGLTGGPSSIEPFGGASAYETTRPGDYVIFVEDEDGPLDLNGSVFLSAGTDHTLAITGQSNLARGMFLADDPGQPDVGKAYIRVANGGRQLGPVDIYVLLPGEQVDGSPTVGSLDWLNATLYGEFDSGEIRLVLTTVGTQNVLFDSGPINLPSASVRTFFLFDGAAPQNEVDLLVLDDGTS